MAPESYRLVYKRALNNWPGEREDPFHKREAILSDLKRTASSLPGYTPWTNSRIPFYFPLRTVHKINRIPKQRLSPIINGRLMGNCRNWSFSIGISESAHQNTSFKIISDIYENCQKPEDRVFLVCTVLKAQHRPLANPFKFQKAPSLPRAGRL